MYIYIYIYICICTFNSIYIFNIHTSLIVPYWHPSCCQSLYGNPQNMTVIDLAKPSTYCLVQYTLNYNVISIQHRAQQYNIYNYYHRCHRRIHSLCHRRLHTSHTIHQLQCNTNSTAAFDPNTTNNDILLPSVLYQQYIASGHIISDESQQSVLPHMNHILLSLQPHQLLMQSYWNELDEWNQLRQQKVDYEIQRRLQQQQQQQLCQHNSNNHTNQSLFHKLRRSIFGVNTKQSNNHNNSNDNNIRYRISGGSNLDELDQSYTVRDGYTGSGKAIWPWLQSKVNTMKSSSNNNMNTDTIDYNTIQPEYLPNSYYGIRDAPTPPAPPKGLYMYGSVGSGKTLLMDLLYSCTNDLVDNRIRVHFNEFLIQIFSLMHEYHQLSQVQRGITNCIHPLDYVCQKLIGGRKLMFLCFDELQLNDVSEAVILKGLFQRLLSNGIILVMTGNRQPSDITNSHLNQTDFNGFLQLIQQHCYMCMIQSGVDYRRVHNDQSNHINRDNNHNTNIYNELKQQYPSYPLFDRSANKDVQQQFNNTVQLLLHHEMVQHNQPTVQYVPQTLQVIQGRNLLVNRAYYGIAEFTFDELCSASLGSADYLSIAKQYHTIIIDQIPLLSINDRDKIRRFIWLIDQLYNNHTSVVTCVSCSIDELLQTAHINNTLQSEIQENLQYEGEVARRGVGVSNRGSDQLWSGADEAFAYARAASRINEMTTQKYWNIRHKL